MPYTSPRFNSIWEVDVKKQSPVGFYGNTEIWYKSKNNIYWIKYFDVDTKTMHEPSFYIFDNQFRLIKKIDGDVSVWDGGDWTVKNGIIQTRDANGSYRPRIFNELALEISETPETFMRSS